MNNRPTILPTLLVLTTAVVYVSTAKFLLAQSGAREHYTHGTDLLDHHDYRLAIREFEEALKMGPPTAEIHNGLAVALWQAGNLDKAQQEFEAAIGLNPGYPEAYNNLGLFLNERDQPDRAIEEFRRALSIDPHNAKVHNNLGLAFWKKVSQEHGAWLGHAIDEFRAALAIQPDSPSIHNNLGLALKYQGHVNEAVAEFHRALTLKPNYLEAHTNLGQRSRDERKCPGGDSGIPPCTRTQSGQCAGPLRAGDGVFSPASASACGGGTPQSSELAAERDRLSL